MPKNTNNVTEGRDAAPVKISSQEETPESSEEEAAAE